MLEQCGDYSKQKKNINIINNLNIAKQNGKILQVSTSIQFSHYFVLTSSPSQYLKWNQKYNVRTSFNLACLAFTKAGGGIIEINTYIYRSITQYCHEKAIKYLIVGSL